MCPAVVVVVMGGDPGFGEGDFCCWGLGLGLGLGAGGVVEWWEGTVEVERCTGWE